MTSSYTEQHPSNSSGKKPIDVALEKNLETIATQIRRTTIKPSQLTRNDLQLFDSTSSREMTPDSINTDSANEDHYSQSVIPPSTVNPSWPSAVYPYPHQPLGFYLPYPTSTNGLPPSFYPSYDPLLIEQHYGPQGLSAYYAQQQAAATVRLLQEHASLSGSAPYGIEKHPLLNLNEQQMMFPPLYHNQMTSIPSQFQSNGDISEKYDYSNQYCYFYLDNLSAILTTPTKEQHKKSSDLITNGSQIKKTSVQNNIQSPSPHQTINKSLSRLSLDLSCDEDGGETNDTDSIISFESQKSNSAISKFNRIE
jgi:hypothetical protein